MADGTMAGSAPYIMWGTLVLFNAATIKLLQVSLKDVNIGEALKEKAPQGTGVTTTMQTVEHTNPADPTAPVTKTDEKTVQPTAAPDEASYSRIAGMIGAVVMAGFLWALANIIIFKTFDSPDDVSKIMSNVGGYFLAGAALFTPYATNKLTTAFKTN